jgi:DNA-binding beta-propeller fold protein YncE
VAVVDTKNHSVIKTLKITGELARPMGVVASPDGTRVYVTTGRGPDAAGHRHGEK